MYRLIIVSTLDDKCQFWLDESSKVLTSPFFDNIYQRYYNDMNCTWIIKAEQGSYVNFEIDYFKVKNNTYSKMISMIFLNDNHYSLIMETTYQSLMEVICNLN